MKKAIFLGLMVLLASCASKKEKSFSNFNAVELKSDCPRDGKCGIELIKNKFIEIKTDEFGKLFYTLKNDDTKNILIFTYDRNVPEGLQDGNYREEIIIEIDKKSGLPTQSKTLFGRFCYCKGETGYYKILETISSKVQNEQIIYELDFKVKLVSQIIKNLKFSLGQSNK